MYSEEFKKECVNGWLVSGTVNKACYCETKDISPRSLGRWIEKYSFKVGDKVVMSENTKWTESSDNPRGMEGEVIEVRSIVLPFRVKWKNGSINTYDCSDIVKVVVEESVEELLNVGDRVCISEVGRKQYDVDRYNPEHEGNVLMNDHGNLYVYEVVWDNNEVNAYCKDEIEKVIDTDKPLELIKKINHLIEEFNTTYNIKL